MEKMTKQCLDSIGLEKNPHSNLIHCHEEIIWPDKHIGAGGLYRNQIKILLTWFATNKGTPITDVTFKSLVKFYFRFHSWVRQRHPSCIISCPRQVKKQFADCDSHTSLSEQPRDINCLLSYMLPEQKKVLMTWVVLLQNKQL